LLFAVDRKAFRALVFSAHIAIPMMRIMITMIGQIIAHMNPSPVSMAGNIITMTPMRIRPISSFNIRIHS
jgi:hypothetical protein